MKIACGLVVKNGKEFINQWIKCAEQFDEIYVIDNYADKEVRDILFKHPKIKHYHIQKTHRNFSRDCQKLLDIAKEEKADWLWILDIDEEIYNFNIDILKGYIDTIFDQSIGVLLLEMWNDPEHFITMKGFDERVCHKCFKVLSHLEYDLNDTHGGSLPPNCMQGAVTSLIVKHYGHMNKKLRDEKRKMYKEFAKTNPIDQAELDAPWMKEDNDEEIKEFKNYSKLNLAEDVKKKEDEKNKDKN